MFGVSARFLLTVTMFVLWRASSRRLEDTTYNLIPIQIQIKKLYCPNKIAFLNKNVSFAAQWWD
jgi:hypothetical protein